ncbi:MAG: YkvA family protein [Gemmatimonadaceae bacterium]
MSPIPEEQVRRKTRGASASATSARTASAPRTGARRTVMYYIKQLPTYLRLLGGLLTDKRVSSMDKLLVAGAIAYIAMPLDLIPDFIPFIGEVDDVFLLVLALQRLVSNAGRQVLLGHWTGALEDLADLNLKEALAAAAFFLPRGIRRKLKLIGRGSP